MLFKKVEMKNRVSLEGYGEILAGRIARPYEKGTPRAKQGDEYWVFFIKHFASISRESESGRRMETGSERKKERERGSLKERRDGIRGERQKKHLCSSHPSQREGARQGECYMMASVC